MTFLLDTHVLIWALENNPTLSGKAREAIIDGGNLIYVSVASIWEMAIKKNLGKLDVPDNLAEELSLHRFKTLPITAEHATRIETLPDYHKDPFDRMLIAQAKHESFTLVTRERQIAKYDVTVLQAQWNMSP